LATVVESAREEARAAYSAAANSVVATESSPTKSADKSFTFTVPPKNSKPSSALNATSQWSTSVASVDIGCIGRHWLHRSTLVTPTPTPPLLPLRAAQLFREAIA
jgi:hypothetical protein